MKQTKLTPIQRFWRLLIVDRKEIRNIYVYAIFNGLISLSLPLGIQAIVNLIQGGQVSTSWVILVFFVVLGIIISGALQIAQLRITENLQQKIFTRAAFEFSYRIPRIKMESLQGHYAPELMNRFFDVNSVQKGLSKILIDFSAAFFLTVFSLILLSLYHPFFILFGLMLVLLVFVIFKYTAKKGMDTSLEESEFKYKVAHWLEELSRTAITFKLAGKTELPLKKTDKYAEKYLSARDNHFKILVLQYSLMVAFKVIVAAGLLIIGGKLVIDQQMNIGQFVAAEIIILIVLSSVEKLILSLESVYDILTSLEKIGFVTDLELERESGTELPSLPINQGVHLEVNNISFSYSNTSSQMLKNISLEIEPGTTTIIAGKSGTGKSTLLHVIAGLYDLKEGTISYNGLPMGNISLSSTRAAIGEFIALETLFEGSILENITLGRKTVTFEKAIWAIDNVGLSDFIKSLPEGYDTQILTQGSGLADSITTKLLIARCIADKPQLLLLENTFEHLDKKEASRIIDFLISPKNHWSIVAVSSNEYFAKKADNIIILDKGEIDFNGNYNEVRQTTKFNTYFNA